MTVVDNSCTPKNAEMLLAITSSRVSIEISDSNIGYTKATNRSVNRDSEYLIIINPDIEIPETFNIQNLTSTLDSDPEIGVIGVKQVNPDNSIAPAIRRYPSLIAQISRRTPLKNLYPFKAIVENYECSDIDWGIPTEVDWLQSSFWLMKKETWDLLGGLDTRFNIFMSDPDFCLRLKKIGLKSYYIPSQWVRADGKRASSGGILSIFKSRPLRIHLLDSIKYYLKHYQNA
nr:glycosyltransferase family 2 protein [Pseudomonas sp. PDM20]MBD9683203.1 glycosyltransferase family 2 protein [Pseudomonas sp. PDM20]